MQIELRVNTRFGHVMTVDPQDHIGKAVIRHGLYDRNGVGFILRVLEKIKARHVLDVGANIGNHSLSFSTSAGHVFSFEPNPAAFPFLQRNISDNGITNVSAFNFGLSDADAEAELFVDEFGNLGASTLREESKLPNHSYRKQQVWLKRGDGWVAANVRGPVDFVKIDVEGHEESVVRGLQATIRKDRPFLIMEWNDRSSDKDGMIKSGISEDVFADYLIYAMYLNTDRRYWKNKPFGSLRRVLTKFVAGKRLQCIRYDPDADNVAFKARELFLVPKEKSAILDELDS